MEVHHPHQPTHKKKWREYLLEFLMLFLAVFLGFLAENKREWIVERHRAEDYARSFLSDLKKDSLEIHGGILQSQFVNTSIDSIVHIAAGWRKNSMIAGSFYFHSRYISYVWIMDWSRSTLTQLIQSGNLRYIRNKELVTKINEYYSWQDAIIFKNQIEHEMRMRSIELRNKILKSSVYAEFAPLGIDAGFRYLSTPRIDSLAKLEYPLNSEAFKYMDEYINMLIDRKERQKSVVHVQYATALKLAAELIRLISFEYHLK